MPSVLRPTVKTFNRHFVFGFLIQKLVSVLLTNEIGAIAPAPPPSLPPLLAPGVKMRACGAQHYCILYSM